MSTDVVHLRTGELITDPTLHDADELAEASLLLRERERMYREMRYVIDAELGTRLSRRRHPRQVWATGQFEVKSANESVWDADELEGVLADLIERGELASRDVEGVLKREVVVSRSTANRLLDRLEGPAHEAIERCRSWRQTGVKVVRSTWPSSLSR